MRMSVTGMNIRKNICVLWLLEFADGVRRSRDEMRWNAKFFVDQHRKAVAVFLVFCSEPVDILPKIFESPSITGNDETVSADEEDDEQRFDDAERFDELNDLVPGGGVAHEQSLSGQGCPAIR